MTTIHDQTKLIFSRFRGSHDLRSFNIAESGTLDRNTRVAGAGRFNNLMADMLALSITIRPDDKEAGESGLISNVLCDRLLVLLEL